MSDPHFPYGGRGHVQPLAGAPALEVHLTSVQYPDDARLALADVHLQVPVGARVALVGPNGAGKSTLLKAIAGLLPTPPGSILIYGKPVGACHHRVAYLAQRGEIDWRFPISLRKLVMTGRYAHLGWLARPGVADWKIVDEKIERLGLTVLAQQQIGELSGGQQQRALLARALTQESEMLLLDEPLNAVDADTRDIISGVLHELCQQGKTILAATHDLGRLENDFDSAVYLYDGRVVPPPPGSFVSSLPVLTHELAH